jgi:uncharacterized membrane protein (DUF485 family)
VEEDIAGGVMIGLIMIVISIVVTTVASVFERKIYNSIDVKSGFNNNY